MALFSRRGASDEHDPTGQEDAAAPTEAAAPSGVTLPEEIVPEVGISFSTYGRAAAVPATTRPAAQPPERTQTVPGLPDNAVLKQALAALPEKPQNTDVMNVMRQALQGHLYVRVQGDAKALIADGQGLTLAVTAIEDKRFLLAFSGGAALQDSVRADGDAATSAVGQPAATVFQNVVAGPYAGLFLDHALQQIGLDGILHGYCELDGQAGAVRTQHNTISGYLARSDDCILHDNGRHIDGTGIHGFVKVEGQLAAAEV
jgi:hypothetical protein